MRIHHLYWGTDFLVVLYLCGGEIYKRRDDTYVKAYEPYDTSKVYYQEFVDAIKLDLIF